MPVDPTKVMSAEEIQALSQEYDCNVVTKTNEIIFFILSEGKIAGSVTVETFSGVPPAMLLKALSMFKSKDQILRPPPGFLMS